MSYLAKGGSDCGYDIYIICFIMDHGSAFFFLSAMPRSVAAVSSDSEFRLNFFIFGLKLKFICTKYG